MADKKPLTVPQEIKLLKAKCDMLGEQNQELHDILVELCHFTGHQRPIIKRGWNTLDPNEPQWKKGAKAIDDKRAKSWKWK